MKTLWKELCVSFLMAAVLPGLVVNTSALLLKGNARELPILESVPETEERPDRPVMVRLSNGTMQQMELEDYLTGVVLGEMPADFEPEALKAQAVAARTYTVKTVQTARKHPDGSICTDSTCCQAYLSREDYLSKGGTEENLEKVRSAVLDTAGYVLTYEGELIEATYFSCSGGSTEDAFAVWGTAYPYLRSVASPGEEDAAHYCDTIMFTPEQFQERLGRTLEGDPRSWFAEKTYTPGGGIDTMTIGGEGYTGTQLRRLLGLPSTAMTISASADTITVVTRGYGHRVGMSQYGADAMAVTGSDYKQILAHYYPGTTLERLN